MPDQRSFAASSGAAPPAEQSTTVATPRPASVADVQAQKRISNRLRRARGQLDAVIAAVEADHPCRDIVMQLAAVSSALNRAGFAIVSTAMKECLTPADPGRSDEVLTTEELEKLFLMLA